MVTVTEPGKVPPDITTGVATCSTTVNDRDDTGLLKYPGAMVIARTDVTVCTVSSSNGNDVADAAVGFVPSTV